jgi:hypothetical protein
MLAWRWQDAADLVVVVRPDQSAGGSAFCICPEARTALRSLLRGTAARVPYAGQHVFECGVMWSFIAFGQHPLPGYPDAYVTAPTFAVQYTEANMTGIPADDGTYWLHGCVVLYLSSVSCCGFSLCRAGSTALHGSPVAFRRLLRRMLSCDAAARPPLQHCVDELRAIVDTDSSAVIDTLKGRVRDLEALLVR